MTKLLCLSFYTHVLLEGPVGATLVMRSRTGDLGSNPEEQSDLGK